MRHTTLFQSYFMGGFECSNHRLHTGRRIDVIGATQHDRFASADYERMAAHGLRTVRDGVRWSLIERRPGHYHFASVLAQLAAAQTTQTEVIWDVCHYGWPDDLDVFAPAFVDRFAAFAAAFACLIRDTSDLVPFYAPMNEISFLAWNGGDIGHINPCARGRGHELKRQLVRATLAATEAIWNVDPRARIVHIDPLINVVADPARPQDRAMTEAYTLSQFEAWDMISGRLDPELGGSPRYLDVLGVNYYSNNQWIHEGRTLQLGDPLYRPLSRMLQDVADRYGRPLFVAETGIEDAARPSWLRYVAGEVATALRWGVPVHGICLYPILNHPGWDDDRHCHNGLFDYCDTHGERELYAPLAEELALHQRAFDDLLAGLPPLWSESPEAAYPESMPLALEVNG